jgi:SDR family mycofactocin-dependent oxidoreductase
MAPLRPESEAPAMAAPARSLEGKVAFVTGVARGQGRAHALRLSREGAAVVGVDIAADIATMDYANATLDDLAETARLVEDQGGRILTRQVDVRDPDALTAAVAAGVERFGELDIVVANAGIIRVGPAEDRGAVWRDIIDVNLTGVWNTVEATVPSMLRGGSGGSVVITSSTAGIKGTGTPLPGGQAYAAAKRGLVGLMQVLANDLAPQWIRVNTIHPTGVATGMVLNEAMQQMLASGGEAVGAMQNALPIAILQPDDMAGAVAWLVSDEARFITGTSIPLDAGFTVR